MIDGKNIVLIQICKNCDCFDPTSHGRCATLGKWQVINMANNCPYFCGELYEFDRSTRNWRKTVI